MNNLREREREREREMVWIKKLMIWRNKMTQNKTSQYRENHRMVWNTQDPGDNLVIPITTSPYKFFWGCKLMGLN